MLAFLFGIVLAIGFIFLVGLVIAIVLFVLWAIAELIYGLICIIFNLDP